MRIYGMDVTVVWDEPPQPTEQMHIKQNGYWVEVQEVYKKVNGVWVLQEDLKSLFSTTTNYVKM